MATDPKDVVLDVTPSTEELTPPSRARDRTPDVAVQNFDGTFDSVYAREVRSNCCTREVFNFAVTCILVLGVAAVCLVLLGIYGFESAGSEWLKAIISFCLGVFVPNPSLKAPPEKKHGSEQVRRSHV